MTFTSFLDNIHLNLQKNVRPNTILDTSLLTNIFTKEKKINNKKNPKTNEYRFVSFKEAKFADEIGYSSKNQSPKQISDTLKLIPSILVMDMNDTKWVREPLYYSYAHIIDAAIFVIKGKKVLRHKYLNASEYAHMTYKCLKDKVDNLIKKLKRNNYLSIGNHQKDYERYAKDFELNLTYGKTYGKILRKCNSENSLRCKEELPRSLVNEKLSFGDNNINIFTKINQFFQKYFNYDRKKKHEYHKLYKDFQNQKNSIVSNLKEVIHFQGIYDLKTEKGSKKMKYLWFKKFNKIELIRGNKKCKELYMEILKTAKQMKYHLSKESLQDLLDYIKLKAKTLSDMLYSIDFDTFKSKPKLQEALKQKPIVNNAFQQLEEKIVKLFNNKLCMSFAMLRNFIFDHKKKIFKLKDEAGQSLIITQIKQFQCMYGDKPIIIRFADVAYNFIA
jgi:hypothetical protein